MLKLTCTELALDTAIYGNPAGAYSENIREANKFWKELIDNLADNLQDVHDMLDEIAEGGFEIKGYETEKEIDLNMICDAVNLLRSLKVDITRVEK